MSGRGKDTDRRGGRSLADDYYAFVAREAQSRDVTGDPKEILETTLAEQ